MKKVIIVVLVCVLAVVIGACRKKDEPAAVALSAATACSAECEPGDVPCPGCEDDPNCKAKVPPAPPVSAPPPAPSG